VVSGELGEFQVRFSANKTTTSVAATLMMMVNITCHHREEVFSETYFDQVV